jgi:hypothetical protein
MSTLKKNPQMFNLRSINTSKFKQFLKEVRTKVEDGENNCKHSNSVHPKTVYMAMKAILNDIEAYVDLHEMFEKEEE